MMLQYNIRDTSVHPNTSKTCVSQQTQWLFSALNTQIHTNYLSYSWLLLNVLDAAINLTLILALQHTSMHARPKLQLLPQSSWKHIKSILRRKLSKQHWIGENDIGIVEEVLDMGRPDNNAELWIDEATLGVEDADASILVSISKY